MKTFNHTVTVLLKRTTAGVTSQHYDQVDPKTLETVPDGAQFVRGMSLNYMPGRDMPETIEATFKYDWEPRT